MMRFTRLRSWPTRTLLKGIRDRWPLRWWWKFTRQLWRERQRPAYAMRRMHFDIDLKVRRLERLHGRRGAYRALSRGHNAALQRSMVELGAMRRKLVAKMDS